MAKKIVTRDYRCTNIELILKAEQLLLCVKRDMEDFAVRGITATLLSELHESLEQFKLYRSDIAVKSVITSSSLDKKNIRSMLSGMAEIVRATVECSTDHDRVWLGPYKFKSFTKRRDIEFYKYISKLIIMVRADMKYYKAGGITNEFVDEMSQLNKMLLDSMGDLRYEKRVRHCSRIERTELGNKLYSNLVMLSNFGKIIYKNKDVLKYKDYELSLDGKKRKSKKEEGGLE
jgi:hypothetical protein